MLRGGFIEKSFNSLTKSHIAILKPQFYHFCIIGTKGTIFVLLEKNRIFTIEDNLILSFDVGDIFNRYSKVGSII